MMSSSFVHSSKGRIIIMKKSYEKPIIEIEEFEVEDIATLSSGGEGIANQLLWGDIE